MMRKTFRVLLPMESDWCNGLLDKIEYLNNIGITVDDIMAEAIKISIACIEYLSEGDLANQIDYTAVYHGVDEITKVTNGLAFGKDYASMAWDNYTDSISDVYNLVYPHISLLLNKSGFLSLDGNNVGYRCNDVEIMTLKYGSDHIAIDAFMVFENENPTYSTGISRV